MASIEQIHQAFLKSNGVTTDSRNCNNGEIFFALKGERFDGNKYVESVLKQGASYAIADDSSLKGVANVFVVDNVLNTLQELARYHRRYLNIPILAITGTNGKTTTKELVASVLSEKYHIKATAGNFNNHIGVPLTLLSMDKNLEFGVVEMGANHVGEIDFLCNIAEPNFGLITNVGKAHLEGFGSFEGVKTAKGELYQYIQKKGDRIFINKDNEHLCAMASQNKIRTEYGINNGTVTGKIIQNTPFIEVEWQSEGIAPQQLSTHLIGGYNLENILSAITIGLYFDLSPDQINKAISNYMPTNNRSQFIQTKSNRIIMDAYNANPSSMQVALNNFKDVDEPNKMVILGGMKELGADSESEHTALINAIESLGLDRAILVGEEFNTLDEASKYEVYHSSNELAEQLKANPITDAYILIKGSRSNQLEKLLELL